jgi:peptidoglycan/LPS O-acetylase OafA/YrhL
MGVESEELTGVIAARERRTPRLIAWLWPVSPATTDTAALDGLRATAVLMTMGFHIVELLLFQGKDAGRFATLRQLEPITDLGQSGVEMFFILSGFLLFLPYAKTMLTGQPLPDPRKFYIRRALRILPAYWVSLLLIVTVLEPQFLDPANRYDVTLHFFLVQDATKATLRSINSPYWTMAVESHFYILLPLIAGAIWWAVSKGRGWLGIAVLLLLVALCPFYFNQLRTPYPFVGETIVRAWYVAGFLVVFAVGMAISWFYIALQMGRLRLTVEQVRPWCKLAGLLGVAFIVGYALAQFYFTVTAPGIMEFNRIWREWLLAAAYGGILLGTLFGWPSWQRLFASTPMRFIGIISYSLYIWNEILYRMFIVPFALRFDSDTVAFIIALLLTPLIILVGFGFYTAVERPFIGLRRQQH